MRGVTDEDTIAAIGTPAGVSPRAIVRLSGPRSFFLLSQILADDPTLRRRQSYTFLHSSLSLPNHGLAIPVDCYLMAAPRSYTREDVAEIHTVGSPVLLRSILDELLALGARAAQPGEFTKRAFLNGRVDLSQAEAVLQVIRARSEAECRLACGQLEGSLSRRITAIRDDLAGLCAETEIAIDFTDQDLPAISEKDVSSRIDAARQSVSEVLEESARAVPPEEGVRVVIFGQPNVGKSSLLNLLAGQARAIVTHLPGTTRDTVEHVMEVEGVTFLLTDTAGLREAEESIEGEAIARSRALLEAAPVALFVVDGSHPLSEQDQALWNESSVEQKLTLINKVDLPRRMDVPRAEALIADSPPIFTSAVTGQGIDEVKRRLVELVLAGAVDASAASFILSVRQRDALAMAGDALGRARDSALAGMGMEFVALDLRLALDYLGEIVGEVTTDDLLERIFANFCIGK